mmetsp:Transcript_57724/g.101421  ORF Transcript_57724/g.101421 Transcript_57724/m.101421 type:complete len:435 (-) Transcript_57724:56-1360(-)
MIVERLGALDLEQGAVGLRQSSQSGGAVLARGLLTQQASEGVGPSHAVRQRLHTLVRQAEDLVGSGEDGGGVEGRGRGGLLSGQSLRHNRALLDPGGDGDGGDANAQLVKGEPVGGHLVIAGNASVRRHDVIVEATVLIVGDEEQGLLPLGARTQGLVHLLDQLLAFHDRGIGVLPVGQGVSVGGGLGLQPGELRKGAGSHILVEVSIELLQVLNVLRGVGVLEIEQCPGVLLVVTAEGSAVLHQVIKVRLLVPEGAVEVGDHTTGRAGHGEGAVGIGRARDGAMPVVEHGEFLSQLIDDWRGGAVEHGDRVGLVAGVSGGVIHKPVHLVLVHLHGDVIKAVKRIVGRDVVTVSGHRHGTLGGIVGITRLRLAPRESLNLGVVVGLEPAQKVVKRSVFHHQNDDVGDHTLALGLGDHGQKHGEHNQEALHSYSK